MAGFLKTNEYGKSLVRLSKIERDGDRHTLREMSVNVTLRGDFDESYTGDNAKVVATDSMKNTVYVLARRHDLGTVEQFAHRLATHFVQTYEQVHECEVQVEESTWQRMAFDGVEHPHAFTGGSHERATGWVCHSADTTVRRAGIKELLILKTTDSAFEGFVRDDYTALAETDDRMFATKLAATWALHQSATDFNRIRGVVTESLLKTFANHDSLSVQHTLYAMGQVALEAAPEITEIELEMPNKHHLLVDLSKFELENNNVVFHPTDEPFGMIRATVARESDSIGSTS